MDSNQLLNHQRTNDSYNDPFKINIEAISDLGEDANTFSMGSHNVDVNVEGLELTKQELFRYLDHPQNRPIATLNKTGQLIALVK